MADASWRRAGAAPYGEEHTEVPTRRQRDKRPKLLHSRRSCTARPGHIPLPDSGGNHAWSHHPRMSDSPASDARLDASRRIRVEHSAGAASPLARGLGRSRHRQPTSASESAAPCPIRHNDASTPFRSIVKRVLQGNGVFGSLKRGTAGSQASLAGLFQAPSAGRLSHSASNRALYSKRCRFSCNARWLRITE